MTESQLNFSIFNSFKNQYFVLSILAKTLMTQGYTVAIERNETKNEEGIKEIYTTVQFLVIGITNFKEYDFIFDFGKEKNKEIINNEQEQKKFSINFEAYSNFGTILSLLVKQN